MLSVCDYAANFRDRTQAAADLTDSAHLHFELRTNEIQLTPDEGAGRLNRPPRTPQRPLCVQLFL